MHDIVIIGGGICGCALAYYLSQYECDVIVIEKENDLAVGTTRANSAILHAGYDPRPGTIMAATNVTGNKLSFELCRELDVEHNRCGSLVLAFTQAECEQLQELLARGEANGVPNQRIISSEEIHKMEPDVSDKVIAGLFAPSAGVVNPWEMALALAEVAARNGVHFKFNTKVISIKPLPQTSGYSIRTEHDDELTSRFVINCAGVHAAEIHQLVAKPTFKITPTKGEYYLLDTHTSVNINHVLFQCPNEKGKGVLVSITMHGNTIVGPNAEVVQDPEDTSNTRAGLQFVATLAKKTVPNLDLLSNIRNFAGVRANCDRKDFVVEFAAENFLDVAGIQSPGLTSAPALALLAIDKLKLAGFKSEKKGSWQGGRKVVRFKHLSPEQRAEQISGDAAYGRVICRCETITEGEIRAALKSLIPPVSLDGIKRRCGSGLGRCQGGFCSPKIVEILAKHYNCRPENICQDKSGTYILLDERREGRYE